MTKAFKSTNHRVEKATEADADDFARVLTAASFSSAINHLSEPDITKWPPRFIDALSGVWKHPKVRTLKAVDDTTGEVIGCAVWAALEGDEFKGHGLETLRALSYHLQIPPSPGESNIASKSRGNRLHQRIQSEILARRFRWIVGKPCQLLAIVGVLPDHQGYEIGESLVEAGMDEANERQVVCYLEATPAGYPVYKKLGWNQIDKDINVDLSEYGGVDNGYGNFKLRCMLKLPDSNA